MVLEAVLVLVALLAAVLGRDLLKLLLREPVGLGVPLLALLILYLAPQMPDMVLGMQAAVLKDGTEVKEWPRALGMAVAGAILGILSWFWTRAGLCAHYRIDDVARYPAEGSGVRAAVMTWPLRWTPRLAIVLAFLITIAPLLILWRRSDNDPNGQFIGWVVGAGVLLNGLVLLFLARGRARLRMVARFPTPDCWWRYHTPSLFAAAPGGWITGLVVLLIGMAACALAAEAPKVVERNLHTPTAALLAMAALIGPLTVSLALLRDAIWAVLDVLLRSAAAIFPRVAPVVEDERTRLRAGATWLGLAAMFALLLLAPEWWQRPGRYLIARIDAPMTEPVRPEGECLPAPSIRRPCLVEAIREWRGAKRELWPAGQPMPLIIVAAEGGASRAAVWLLRAMKLLDERTDGLFGQQVFAISAVSGGALGAVTYLQALRHHEVPGTGRVDWRENRPPERALNRLATGDLLAASIATYFTQDTLGSLWGRLWPWSTDRGRQLELAFERHWQWGFGLGLSEAEAQQGLLDLRPRGRPGLPHLLLNGTDREAGRRAITATFRFRPRDDVFTNADDVLTRLARHNECAEPGAPLHRQSGSQDGCGAERPDGRRVAKETAESACVGAANGPYRSRLPEGILLACDVPAATAVHNAARFPYISPAGRFHASERGQLLDGGYFENYGARTALELAVAVDRIVADEPSLNLVPIVVVVSNDADGWASAADAQRGRSSELRLREDDERLLRNRTMHCDWEAMPLAAETLARRGFGGGAQPQILAPITGLYAIRSGHGQDSLHSLRRALCPDGRATPGDPARLRRLIHIALPRPLPGLEEAAPMNWVLNGAAAQFLLRRAPDAEFNVEQAGHLTDTLWALCRWRSGLPDQELQSPEHGACARLRSKIFRRGLLATAAPAVSPPP